MFVKLLDTTRRAPVQERSKIRVQRILSAAALLMRSKPLDSVTIREIAQLAEVSPATVYQFFPHREAIFQHVLVRNFEKLDHRLERELESAAIDSIEDAVRVLVQAHETHYASDQKIIDLFYNSPLPAALAQENLAHHQRLAGILSATLLQHQLIKPQTPDIAFAIAIEVGSRIFEMSARQGEIDREVIQEGELLICTYLRLYQS